MSTAHSSALPLPTKKGGYMYKRAWGGGIMKYCPINKVCWSISKGNRLNIYNDMPTYGLEREELPKNLKQGE